MVLELLILFIRFVLLFIISHFMIFVFGFLNYQLKVCDSSSFF